MRCRNYFYVYLPICSICQQSDLRAAFVSNCQCTGRVQCLPLYYVALQAKSGLSVGRIFFQIQCHSICLHVCLNHEVLTNGHCNMRTTIVTFAQFLKKKKKKKG